MSIAGNNQELDNPILILIRGIPGSGKSYVAAALRDTLGEDRVLLLDPDATDYKSQEYADMSKSLTADGVEAKFHPYRFLRAKAEKGIVAHKIIIWNQAFTLLGGFQRTVTYLQDYATQQGTHLPLLVVEIDVDEATARQRVAKRAEQGGHDVSEENFARFMQDYRSFSEEGFNTIAVNGNDDVSTSVAAILKALEQLQCKG